MKKYLAFVLIFVVMLLGGCGNKQKNVSKGKVEIKLLANNRAEMDVMKRLVDKYNDENDKNIYINYEVKNDNIDDVLKVSYSSKNPPDIHTSFGGAYYNSAVKSGWLKPLENELVREYEEKFMKGCLEPSDVDGKYYDVKTGGPSGSKFLWNKDLFKECGLDPEQPPKTFEQMREYAKIITSKGNGQKYGFVLPLKDAAFIRYYVMIPGSLSGLYNADGFEPTTGKYDYSIYEPMINILKSVIKDGSVFPSPYNIDNDTARAQFAEGNIGMIYAMGWDVGVFNDQFPAKCDWGIGEYPVMEELKGGYPYSIGGSGGGFQMSALSKHPEEQLTVWKWLISEEVLKEMQMNGKGATSLKSIMKSEFLNTQKKGSVEFTTIKYPIHILDKPQTPTTNLSLEGDDCFSALKTILLEDVNVKEELQVLTDRYNKSLENLEKSGADIKKYKIEDWNFVVEK